MPTWLNAVLTFVMPALSKILPDEAAREQFKAQLALASLAQEGAQLQADLQSQLAQAEITKTEAASPSFWKSGARPGILWVGFAALLEHFVLWPYWSWFAAIYKLPIPPKLDVADLMPIVLALLGVGTMRSYDKKNGTS